MERVRRGDFLKLLAYGFYYARPSEPACAAAGGGPEALGAVADALLAKAGMALPEGEDASLRFMDHLWDDLPAQPRPLVFYALTEALGLMTHAALAAAGFERHDVGGVAYYTRGCGLGLGGGGSVGDGNGGSGGNGSGGDGGDSSAAPVLFLHGVGQGLLPYLDLLFLFASRGAGGGNGGGRPIIAPEFRHISMRWARRIPTVGALADSAARLLAALGHARAHAVGHSYGSLVASRFCQAHPGRVASAALLDPVCVGMFMPDLLYNFLYARPRLFGGTGSGCGSSLVDVGMWLFSRELHMTATFCRCALFGQLGALGKRWVAGHFGDGGRLPCRERGLVLLQLTATMLSTLNSNRQIQNTLHATR